jgi:glycosyltransferase involved in cell wall biosynthesis
MIREHARHKEAGARPYRLAVINTHPIQYFAPLYRFLARHPELELVVYYCSRLGVEMYSDPGFGRRLQWDVPLLEGYDHRFLHNWGRSARGGFAGWLNPGIVAELLRERFDAVWVHGHGFATAWLAFASAKLAGSALFMRCETHLGLPRSALKRKLRALLMPRFYSAFDAVLPIGTSNAAFYSALGVPSSRQFQVPYTVDNDFFGRAAERWRKERGALRSELAISPSSTAFVFASKLIPRKRPEDLLAAFAGLRERGVEADLLVVGSGELESSLRAIVRTKAIPGVHFLGFRNQTELPRVFAAADAFVLPSEDEPWGLVVNEAMAAGLPVVASEEVGAAKDLVRPGENGYTFKAGDVRELEGRLAELASDTALRARMAEASRSIIERWGFAECLGGVVAALRATQGERGMESRGSR